MEKRITIKDIARKLNLHHATVSRALRDDPRVTPETKSLVVSLAEELGYYPNLIAQSMTSKSTKTIGIIIPEIMHEFFGSVISGAEDVAFKNGYNIIVCQSSEKFEREVVNLRTLVSKQVDGLLVSISQETRDAEHFLFAQRSGIPLVFFNRLCEGVEAPTVIVDDYGGAISVMEHLIKTGRRRIAHFSGPSAISVSQNRFRAYIDALKKYNISIDEDLIIPGGFSEEDGVIAAHKLLQLGKKLPDAVFTVNDPVAIGALMCFKENKIKVPDDIAIAGFSDDRVSSFIEPPLTTVRQPTREMGEKAMQLLLSEICDENGKNLSKTIVLKSELILRESA